MAAASTSRVVCELVAPPCAFIARGQPVLHTFAGARFASSSSRSATSPAKSRSKRPAPPPSPNSLTFSEAVRTLRAISPGDTTSAFELTLLPRLAPSVNINSLRGRTFLPYDASNTKKKEVILVFAEGELAEQARREGADIVGGSELIDEVLQSRISPTKIICAPDQLAALTRSQLPRLLGPKGLMPSAKRGSVTAEIGKAIKEARGGLDWMGTSIGSSTKGSSKDKSDRGVVAVAIGRMDFDEEQIRENVRHLGQEILNVCNGVGTQAEVSTGGAGGKKKTAQIEKMYLTTTKGISVHVTDVQQLLAQ